MAELLRGQGVPAFAEMSLGFNLYTDIVATRVWIEVSLVKLEHLEYIREAMGRMIHEGGLRNLQEYLTQLPPTSTLSESVDGPIVARFASLSEASLYADVLQRNGLKAIVTELEGAYELRLETSRVSPNELRRLRDFLGGLLDESSLQR